MGFIARSLRFCSLLVVVALILAACGSPTTTAPSATTGASAAGSPGAEPSTAASPAASADASAAPATTETTSGSTSGQTIKVTTTNAPDENNPADIARHEQLLEEFKQVRPDVEIDAH
ncbi:MAG: hypothetical protein JOZ51_14440, partial [Chloroflexi bacterium]|nr:hypothetical protein [Chloroflexota bacterium]